MSQELTTHGTEALKAFAERRKHYRPCRSVSAQCYREACAEHGSRRTRRMFLGLYIQGAVEAFAAGSRREGRRFYDGAFLFGDREVVRRRLLKICVNSARKAFVENNHDAVWNLLWAVRQYPPEDMTPESILVAFSKAGVDKRNLAAPPAHIPSYALA